MKELQELTCLTVVNTLGIHFSEFHGKNEAKMKKSVVQLRSIGYDLGVTGDLQKLSISVWQ
jgi:hypothetical protein